MVFDTDDNNLNIYNLYKNQIKIKFHHLMPQLKLKDKLIRKKFY
jgi:hypothetical protein